LYLPEAWASDAERREKAGVPEEIGFATKPQIALEQIRAACAAGFPRRTCANKNLERDDDSS
jgi:SRSO17 transposase